MGIPSRGLSRDEVFAGLEHFRSGDVGWRSGRMWAYVYDAGNEVEDVTKDAYASFLTENGLDPTVFPSTLLLENAVVGAMARHLNAPEGAAGSFTSGGTESVMLAVKTARDHARATRPEVTRPNIVLPDTAHACFQKAAYYMDLETRITPVDDGYRADVDAMAAATDDQTILLVGSAVSYAHGVVDPIERIAGLARERGVLCHVDGCIGGFVLPYFRRLGAEIPPFDLSVPGVTSISCDLHKYAFAPKGASVVLYSSRELRKHQIYACSTWSGYTIINNTIQSTKSAGPLAAAWAALNFIGDDGYLALCRRMYEATRQVCERVRRHPDLFLLAEPDTNLVAVGSNTVDVFHVVDEMKLRGWFIQPQLGYANSPKNFHLSVNPKAERWVDDLFADLDVAIEAARELPSGNLASLVEGMLAGGDGELSPDGFDQMLGAVGIDGVELPERMAPINEILDSLPPKVREQMLVDFVNQLYLHDPE